MAPFGNGLAAVLLITAASVPVIADDGVDIGSRRELLVDDYLIESMDGVRLQLHRPQPHEVVLVTDKPWEGNTCAYYTIFQDGDIYRMYYRGSHWDTQRKKAAHPEVVCYAESSDGVHWTKPELGLCEFDGSKANNIIWDGVGSHNFTPFKDTHPDCAPEARYKALARGRSLQKDDRSSQHGLFAFQSPDGIHWQLMKDEPVITEGAFDSQNLAFYDPISKVYRDYHRWFNQGKRDIMLCTSHDFMTWTKPVGLQYTEQKREHLYTNAIRQYERAPHLFIGFPTRFLPEEAERVEPVFMTSRDGLHFHRWAEALIPEDAPEDRKGNRSNYITNALVQLPGNDREYSVYATEAYYTGPDSRVRRFTFRVDGFVSATAGNQGGSLTTRPLVFAGNKLELNFDSSKTGLLRVEIQDADGQPIQGFDLQNCVSITGDSTQQVVSWQGGQDLSKLAGQPVRLLFELRDANLFSFRFSQD